MRIAGLLEFGLALFSAAALAAPTPPPIGNFALVDQNGKPFQLHDLRGNYVFLTFIFTRCPLPKMCPLTMSRSNELVRQWGRLKGAPPLRILAVTLDPEHDTPKVLKSYARRHRVDERVFRLATGVPQVLSDLAAEFNVAGFPGQGSITHNMKNILLGPELSAVKAYKDNEWTAPQVIGDMSRYRAREQAPTKAGTPPLPPSP